MGSRTGGKRPRWPNRAEAASAPASRPEHRESIARRSSAAFSLPRCSGDDGKAVLRQRPGALILSLSRERWKSLCRPVTNLPKQFRALRELHFLRRLGWRARPAMHPCSDTPLLPGSGSDRRHPMNAWPKAGAHSIHGETCGDHLAADVLKQLDFVVCVLIDGEGAFVAVLRAAQRDGLRHDRRADEDSGRDRHLGW